MASFPVLVGGSRRASAPCVASARALGVALASSPLVSGLFVGCAGGVDQAVLCGWGSVRGVSGVSLFAVGGPSGAGWFGGSVPPVVSRFAAAGGSVVWWAGGGAGLPLRARLARRSSAALSGAVSAGAAFGVFLVSSPFSRGSFRSVAGCVSAGLPVFLVPFFSGPPPSVAGGSWVPSPFLGGAFSINAECDDLSPINISHSDYLIPDLDGHDFPQWYQDFLNFTPDITVSRSRQAGLDLQHLVWITKYRKEILYGRLRDTIEVSLRFKATQLQVEILELAIMPDHVHLIIDKPKHHSIAYIAQGFKGLSSRVVRLRHPHLTDMHIIESAFWAKRYFSCSVGSGSANKVKNYIQSQSLVTEQE